MHHRLKLTIAVVAAIVASGLLTACGGGSEGDGGRNGSPVVVATTTQVADLVRNVGGSQLRLTQVMQPGSDPHGFEPRPSDVAETAGAVLVFASGQDLDPWAERLVADSGSDAELVDLSSGLPLLTPDTDAHETGHGGDEHDHGSELDPHWWHDPRNAIAAVEVIADHLADVDPDGARLYRRNAEDFIRRIERLDGQIEACLSRIPAGQRKLVTEHKAFGYLTARYDLELIGTVLPALTSQAQPSARDLSELAELIEDEDVPAIFPESSLSPKLAESIASQTGATAEHVLFGDSLGPADSDGATYIQMMAANARAIADGLSGGEVECEFEPDE